MPRIPREKFKVRGDVFSEHTNRILFQLSSQGHFEELKSPISTGKEANIFSAINDEGDYVIIKIYRLETADFNKMYDYIKQDPRYFGIKRNRRQVIFEWTQREFRNLTIARKVGVRVPTPLARRDNIIIMEMIGDEGIPAPQLKNLLPEKADEFFEKIIEYILLLYKKGKIVHGDLSQFNILNYYDEPVFIDFSQSTSIKAPNAKELLVRDLRNIITFFKKNFDFLKEDVHELTKKYFYEIVGNKNQ